MQVTLIFNSLSLPPSTTPIPPHVRQSDKSLLTFAEKADDKFHSRPIKICHKPAASKVQPERSSLAHLHRATSVK